MFYSHLNNVFFLYFDSGDMVLSDLLLNLMTFIIIIIKQQNVCFKLNLIFCKLSTKNVNTILRSHYNYILL